jgi:hypothetical protein
MAVFGPDIEAASHATVGANRLGLADTVFPHCLFGLGKLKNRSKACFWFNALDPSIIPLSADFRSEVKKPACPSMDFSISALQGQTVTQ